MQHAQAALLLLAARALLAVGVEEMMPVEMVAARNRAGQIGVALAGGEQQSDAKGQPWDSFRTHARFLSRFASEQNRRGDGASQPG